MIQFHSQNKFNLDDPTSHKRWLHTTLEHEGFVIDQLSIVFCDDDYLLGINQEFLAHDTYTDIITFDYTEGDRVNAELYISTERVTANALKLDVPFAEELRRVMIHGLLHVIGFGDKTEEEKELMRGKEDDKLSMFHVKQ